MVMIGVGRWTIDTIVLPSNMIDLYRLSPIVTVAGVDGGGWENISLGQRVEVGGDNGNDDCFRRRK